MREMEKMGIMQFFSSLLGIFTINLVLSGDNAVVIALATLNLEGKDKRKGIFWGTFGAVVLRIVLTLVAVALLSLPLVQAIGGLLLIWIAVRLLASQEEETKEQKASSNLFEAIKTIIIADLLMSLDNVLAVAGAAGGNYVLLILGLAISIPIVVFGSTVLSAVMERWKWIVSLGAGLLGYTAGEMVVGDKFLHFLHDIAWLEHGLPWVLAVAVIVSGNLLKYNKKKKVEKGTSV
jgi:YjbE family integral membrane protein